MEEDSFFKGQDEQSTHVGMGYMRDIRSNRVQETVGSPTFRVSSGWGATAPGVKITTDALAVASQPSQGDAGVIDTFTPASWQSGHSTQRARQLNMQDGSSPQMMSDLMLIQA